jgi:transcriptional regulator with XRE-family HTH domain
MALDDARVSQADLMSKFEVSRQTVSRWCNDVGHPPKRFILEAIADMCEVSQRWLIDGIADDAPDPWDDRSGVVRADVEIPQRARLVVVDDDGAVVEDATRRLAPLMLLERPKSVILRLTAECAANCATGDYGVTLPHPLPAAA